MTLPEPYIRASPGAPPRAEQTRIPTQGAARGRRRRRGLGLPGHPSAAERRGSQRGRLCVERAGPAPPPQASLSPGLSPEGCGQQRRRPGPGAQEAGRPRGRAGARRKQASALPGRLPSPASRTPIPARPAPARGPAVARRASRRPDPRPSPRRTRPRRPEGQRRPRGRSPGPRGLGAKSRAPTQPPTRLRRRSPGSGPLRSSPSAGATAALGPPLPQLLLPPPSSSSFSRRGARRRQPEREPERRSGAGRSAPTTRPAAQAGVRAGAGRRGRGRSGAGPGGGGRSRAGVGVWASSGWCQLSRQPFWCRFCLFNLPSPVVQADAERKIFWTLWYRLCPCPCGWEATPRGRGPLT